MYKTKKKKEVLEGKEYVKQDLTGFFVENKKKKNDKITFNDFEKFWKRRTG